MILFGNFYFNKNSKKAKISCTLTQMAVNLSPVSPSTKRCFRQIYERRQAKSLKCTRRRDMPTTGTVDNFAQTERKYRQKEIKKSTEMDKLWSNLSSSYRHQLDVSLRVIPRIRSVKSQNICIVMKNLQRKRFFLRRRRAVVP